MTTIRIFIIAVISHVLIACAGLNNELITTPVQETTRKKTIEAKKTSVINKSNSKFELPAEKSPSVQTYTKSALPPVVALISDANQSSQSGNLDAAAVTIERALRIEPRNAALVYELAGLRLKQEKFRLAEDLARKAVLLSANDIALKKRSWLLIAQVRHMQGDEQGAAIAEKKAAALRND